MFASGWPGTGLLVLRLALCGFLLQCASTGRTTTAMRCLEAIAALLITVGLWTPIAGLLTALLELWTAISNHQVWPFLLAASVGVALSLVGPGAFSIDGHRFGRKRVVFDDTGK